MKYRRKTCSNKYNTSEIKKINTYITKATTGLLLTALLSKRNSMRFIMWDLRTKFGLSKCASIL